MTNKTGMPAFLNEARAMARTIGHLENWLKDVRDETTYVVDDALRELTEEQHAATLAWALTAVQRPDCPWPEHMVAQWIIKDAGEHGRVTVAEWAVKDAGEEGG